MWNEVRVGGGSSRRSGTPRCREDIESTVSKPRSKCAVSSELVPQKVVVVWLQRPSSRQTKSQNFFSSNILAAESMSSASQRPRFPQNDGSPSLASFYDLPNELLLNVVSQVTSLSFALGHCIHVSPSLTLTTDTHSACLTHPEAAISSPQRDGEGSGHVTS